MNTAEYVIGDIVEGFPIDKAATARIQENHIRSSIREATQDAVDEVLHQLRENHDKVLIIGRGIGTKTLPPFVSAVGHSNVGYKMYALTIES